ncbi:MAG TPA: hypothetical protein PKD00_01115 [Burkholderiales bacterium]|mgnify:CR=1 FL=1|nr:hypothetical protein [Burkholderiales bacterium]
MFINNLQLHRNLKLYQQIYNFNHLTAIIAHPSWLNADIKAENDIFNVKQTEFLFNTYIINSFYHEINDIWLKLISLPTKQLNHLLQQTILFLISHDKSLPLDSKKRLLIQESFKLPSFKKIFLKDNASIKISIPSLKTSLLNNKNFISLSSSEILNSIYKTKNSAMFERLKFRFTKDFHSDPEIIDFWNQVSKEHLENAVLFTAKKYFANFFTN